MSGSAGIHVLEEQVQYTYGEFARRKLRPEDYDNYFKKRRDGMLAVISHSEPHFIKWRKDLAAAGVKLNSIPIFVGPDGDTQTRFQIEMAGASGQTVLTVDFVTPPTAAQKKIITELSKHLEYEALARRYTEAQSPPLDETKFISGIMEVRPFKKFTLAMAITGHMRKSFELLARKELSHRLNRIAMQVSPAFEEIIKRGKMWIDPETLISYQDRFGTLPKDEELLSPASSKFNFFGPLFDEHGGRTSSNLGGVAVVSMLFLSKNKKWESDPKFAINRGEFENWFRWIIRDPKDVEREVKHAFERFFVPAGTVEPDDTVGSQDTRSTLEGLFKNTWLYNIATKPYFQKLKVWSLADDTDLELRKTALRMLLAMNSWEVPEAWEVLAELMGKHKYSGGSQGITPILTQAATEIAFGPMRLSKGLDQDLVVKMRQRAKEALGFLIAAHQRRDLPEDDRTWTVMGLKTYQNHIYSALEEIKSESQKYDKDYLLGQQKLIDSVVGPKLN